MTEPIVPDDDRDIPRRRGRPWIMAQGWRDLAFIHWRIPAERLRPLVPPPLLLDEHDGTAWLGLTPFRVVKLRLRFLPPFPVLSTFPEINMRTYVRLHGEPGAYFFSLDAGSHVAAAAARIGYRLPYRAAEMNMARIGAWIEFRSRRADGTAAFEGGYRPSGPDFQPDGESLAGFLTERYALFHPLDDGRIMRVRIHHPAWSLRPAEAVIDRNTLPAAHGIEGLEGPPVVHFAARQDTKVEPPIVLSGT